MLNCTITRTHRRGQKLHERDRDPPVPGPLRLEATMPPELRRVVKKLTIVRHGLYGSNMDSPIPDLWQPELQALISERAMMITGFEEIGAQRYYQGWYVPWK